MYASSRLTSSSISCSWCITSRSIIHRRCCIRCRTMEVSRSSSSARCSIVASSTSTRAVSSCWYSAATMDPGAPRRAGLWTSRRRRSRWLRAACRANGVAGVVMGESPAGGYAEKRDLRRGSTLISWASAAGDEKAASFGRAGNALENSGSESW